MINTSTSVPRVALYHPWPPIEKRSISGWIKTMLLFFDAVAVLISPGAHERFILDQEETALPLLDTGMLKFLDPALMIDQATAQRMISFLELTVLTADSPFNFERSAHNILVREGGIIYPGRRAVMTGEFTPPIHPTTRRTIMMLWSRLHELGLASDVLMDETLRVSKTFWGVYEAFLAHSLRPAGLRAGLDLQPTTDEPRLVRTLARMLDLPGMPSAGHVLSFDLERVAIDLSDVPLDDVLDFRHQYGDLYRAYVIALRQFATELSTLPPQERDAAFQQRQDEISDAAEELRRRARTRWRRPAASVAIGVAGAAWSATKGQWAEAIVSLLGSIAGASAGPQSNSMYSYLFQAQNRLSQ